MKAEINKISRMANNQYLIFTIGSTFFKSYDSTIVKTTFEDGKRVVYLDEYYWNYSRTTSKYRNRFLGETTKEIQAKIKSGEYRLVNLND